jgi:hypothetical protein
MKKLLSLALVFLLSLTGAFAAVSTDYNIDFVKINGLVATETGNAIYAERGEPLDVEVFISSLTNNKAENLKVRAWIEGYEDVKDVSEMFDFKDLTKNVSRSIPLTLNLPEDMDASKEYTLYVKVSDNVNSVERSYTLRIEETRHKLNIQDVVFYPSNTVEAGRYLRTVVRLENMGDRKEQDIKVTVSVPELGIATADYIDELVSVEEDDDDEETSQSTNELILQIPQNAETGDYELKITAEYNRGHDIVTKKEIVHVEGKKVLSEAEAIISIDTSAKELAQGQETVYKIALVSLTDDSVIYSAEVAGTETWATAKVDPAFVTLEPGKAAELLVKVTPNKDAAGKHMFTIKLKEGNNLVKETTLNTEVVKRGIDWTSTKTVLEYGFGVLVIILVILGLIIAFKRKPPEESSDETGTEESYY